MCVRVFLLGLAALFGGVGGVVWAEGDAAPAASGSTEMTEQQCMADVAANASNPACKIYFWKLAGGDGLDGAGDSSPDMEKLMREAVVAETPEEAEAIARWGSGTPADEPLPSEADPAAPVAAVPDYTPADASGGDTPAAAATTSADGAGSGSVFGAGYGEYAGTDGVSAPVSGPSALGQSGADEFYAATGADRVVQPSTADGGSAGGGEGSVQPTVSVGDATGGLTKGWVAPASSIDSGMLSATPMANQGGLVLPQAGDPGLLSKQAAWPDSLAAVAGTASTGGTPAAAAGGLVVNPDASKAAWNSALANTVFNTPESQRAVAGTMETFELAKAAKTTASDDFAALLQKTGEANASVPASTQVTVGPKDAPSSSPLVVNSMDSKVVGADSFGMPVTLGAETAGPKDAPSSSPLVVNSIDAKVVGEENFGTPVTLGAETAGSDVKSSPEVTKPAVAPPASLVQQVQKDLTALASAAGQKLGLGGQNDPMQALSSLMGAAKSLMGGSSGSSSGGASANTTPASAANSSGCYYNIYKVRLCPYGTSGATSDCAANASGVLMCTTPETSTVTGGTSSNGATASTVAAGSSSTKSTLTNSAGSSVYKYLKINGVYMGLAGSSDVKSSGCVLYQASLYCPLKDGATSFTNTTYVCQTLNGLKKCLAGSAGTSASGCEPSGGENYCLPSSAVTSSGNPDTAEYLYINGTRMALSTGSESVDTNNCANVGSLAYCKVTGTHADDLNETEIYNVGYADGYAGKTRNAEYQHEYPYQNGYSAGAAAKAAKKS